MRRRSDASKPDVSKSDVSKGDAPDDLPREMPAMGDKAPAKEAAAAPEPPNPRQPSPNPPSPPRPLRSRPSRGPRPTRSPMTTTRSPRSRPRWRTFSGGMWARSPDAAPPVNARAGWARGVRPALVALALLIAAPVAAQTVTLDLGQGGVTERALQLVALITVLSLAPSILVMVTCFTRIVVVLSLLRTAIGTQTAPPNAVIVGARAVPHRLRDGADVPGGLRAGRRAAARRPDRRRRRPSSARRRRSAPSCWRHVREKDLALFLDLSREPAPATPADVPLQVLVPAFMISELRRAFEIGFLLFVPFLIIDLVVASVLMSMGMMMLPPVIDLAAVQADLLRAGRRLEPGRRQPRPELRLEVLGARRRLLGRRLGQRCGRAPCRRIGVARPRARRYSFRKPSNATRCAGDGSGDFAESSRRAPRSAPSRPRSPRLPGCRPSWRRTSGGCGRPQGRRSASADAIAARIASARWLASSGSAPRQLEPSAASSASPASGQRRADHRMSALSRRASSPARPAAISRARSTRPVSASARASSRMRVFISEPGRSAWRVLRSTSSALPGLAFIRSTRAARAATWARAAPVRRLSIW